MLLKRTKPLTVATISLKSQDCELIVNQTQKILQKISNTVRSINTRATRSIKGSYIYDETAFLHQIKSTF